eukprot:TRINITY_DN10784_c0_g2_i1.p1 TRINITY_DN10784_c0_g2~~TRINITY_DN10784_c0_g2_i1.p1  ORF type:complete len:781 (+),score=170.34 TRINITY_DN10784_c0_g2_i1:231-2345(+)
MDVSITAPGMPNLTLVDIPGVVTHLEGQEAYDMSRKLTKEYTAPERNNIAVVVNKGNVDIGTSMTAAMFMEDHGRAESIGVLTKMDLVTSEQVDDVLALLQGQHKHSDKLPQILFGLVVKPKTYKRSKLLEGEAIFQQPPFNKVHDRCGLDAVTRKLVNLQDGILAKELPHLNSKIDRRIAVVKKGINAILAEPTTPEEAKARGLSVTNYIKAQPLRPVDPASVIQKARNEVQDKQELPQAVLLRILGDSGHNRLPGMISPEELKTALTLSIGQANLQPAEIFNGIADATLKVVKDVLARVKELKDCSATRAAVLHAVSQKMKAKIAILIKEAPQITQEIGNLNLHDTDVVRNLRSEWYTITHAYGTSFDLEPFQEQYGTDRQTTGLNVLNAEVKYLRAYTRAYSNSILEGVISKLQKQAADLASLGLQEFKGLIGGHEWTMADFALDPAVAQKRAHFLERAEILEECLQLLHKFRADHPELLFADLELNESQEADQTTDKDGHPGFKTWLRRDGKPVSLDDDQDDVPMLMEATADEFKMCQDLFQQSMPSSPLKRVERVQSLSLWHRYSDYVNSIKRDLKGDDVNEQQLFHGTRKTDPTTVVESTGIDFRHSGNGMFGRGTYFAERSSYSNKYCFQDRRAGNCQMFLAYVAAGNVEQCESRTDSSRVKPNTGFHSVRGKVSMNDYAYVIYDVAQSYPGFLLTY